MSQEIRDKCWAPGDETVPRPQAYEAIGFRDYFRAGLTIPCEPFVSEVLERFGLQIHHLTPNGICRLSIFAMALKFIGVAPHPEPFIRNYGSYGRLDTKSDKERKIRYTSEFGGYNFTPRLHLHSQSLVPMYKAKWSGWKDHWFYIRVCSDVDVEAAKARGPAKAHPLVSRLSPIKEKAKAQFIPSTAEDEASQYYYRTASKQTSRDLVEEWEVLNLKALDPSVRFANFVRTSSGCKVPDVAFDHLPEAEKADYAEGIERDVAEVFDAYGVKEHKACTELGLASARLNRMFDLIGVPYSNRRDPSLPVDPSMAKAKPRGRGKGGRLRSTRGQGSRTQKTQVLETKKRKRHCEEVRCSEPNDITFGRQIAKAVKRSSERRTLLM